MTYQELLAHILKMTEEQRSLHVVVNDRQRGEFYPVKYLIYNVESDIIDSGNPTLVINP